MTLTKEQVTSILTLSGFQVLSIWELVNQYWPRHKDYYPTIVSSPWWLIRTNYGLIEIGPRKSVISIDWSETGFEATNTYRLTNGDSVTVSPSMVHAWNILDAVRYMTNLFIMIEENPSE